MTVAIIRTLLVIIQIILLAIQIVADIDWLCVPIILIMVFVLALKKYEE